MRNIGYKSAFGKYRRFKILFVFISIFTIPNFLISNSYADDATNWFNKGSKAYCKGNYDEAIKDCTKAIELNPKYAKAYYFRGRAYYDKGLYDEAIEDYNKTIKLNPKHADAYWCRGLAYDKKGLHNEAIKDYTKANNIYKNYKAESLLTGEGLFNKGLSYYKEGDYYKAKITFVEFINKYPNSRLIPKVRYYLGRTNMGLGDYINAVNNFLIVLKLEPKNKEVQKYIAESYKKMSQEKKVLPIAIGDSLQDCLQSLGSPDVGKESVLGQVYRWDSKGIGVLFSPWGYAKMISFNKQCKYMTREGVRIGDKKSKVLKVYGSNWRSYDGGKSVLIYDYYKIMFTFEKGLVSSISLGGP